MRRAAAEQGEFKLRFFPYVVVALSWTTPIWADSSGELQDSELGHYIAGAYGYWLRDNSGSRNWAHEIRFGSELDLPEGQQLRLDLVHVNEGHPTALGQRDGFGAQLVWRRRLTRKLEMELGIGPLLTFNSIEIDGTKADEKQYGAMTSVALLYPVGSGGTHIRAVWDRVTVARRHSTSVLLVGIGKDFGRSTAGANVYANDQELSIGVFGGFTVTNGGGTERALNYGFEVQQHYRRHLALSAFVVSQGDDKIRTDRYGVGVQVWRVLPFGAKWSISGGIGPLLAFNKRDQDHSEIDGLITLRAGRWLGASARDRIYFDFNRIFSQNDLDPDADLFRVGIARIF